MISTIQWKMNHGGDSLELRSSEHFNNYIVGFCFGVIEEVWHKEMRRHEHQCTCQSYTTEISVMLILPLQSVLFLHFVFIIVTKKLTIFTERNPGYKLQVLFYLAKQLHSRDFVSSQQASVSSSNHRHPRNCLHSQIAREFQKIVRVKEAYLII